VPITQGEIDIILDDATKRIDGDLRWSEDEDHSPAFQFRAEVGSDAGYPLQINGRINALAGTVSFTLIHKGTGRIYALDLGADHHNPTCQCVGEKHKHRWTEQYADKQAYAPGDITVGVDDPVELWRQFCLEAKITHNGSLERPPAVQQGLLL
jgi:hypothetical protein